MLVLKSGIYVFESAQSKYSFVITLAQNNFFRRLLAKQLLLHDNNRVFHKKEISKHQTQAEIDFVNLISMAIVIKLLKTIMCLIF